jgi:hypothetical protein
MSRTQKNLAITGPADTESHTLIGPGIATF